MRNMNTYQRQLLDNLMKEQIANLTEAEAKLLLEYAMTDLRNAIYSPRPDNDAEHLGWLTGKIETLSKENTTQP